MSTSTWWLEIGASNLSFWWGFYLLETALLNVHFDVLVFCALWPSWELWDTEISVVILNTHNLYFILSEQTVDTCHMGLQQLYYQAYTGYFERR